MQLDKTRHFLFNFFPRITFATIVSTLIIIFALSSNFARAFRSERLTSVVLRHSKLSSVLRMSTKVTTYNVLSSHLGDASYFNRCDPDACDAPSRLSKLKQKLDKEVSKKAIVCLQEVSTSWSGDLHAYFASQGYVFVTGMYGKKFNGYMGVGIAVPADKYDIVNADITTIADTKKYRRKERQNFVFIFLLTLLRKIGLIGKPPQDPWEEAAYRNNQMVTLRLKEKNNNNNNHSKMQSSFCVGTYHMPCMFKLPGVMMIHSALSAKHIQRLAGSDPYIFCGDFNIKPQSNMYRMLTNGGIESECDEVPEKDENDSSDWDFKMKPLRSAYMVKNGKEPLFTNYAQTKFDKQPFIDCLDYIFLSDEWIVKKVEDTPTEQEVQGPMPTLTQPSDHLLISAELEIN